jgi:hypothetical protein
LEDEKKQFIKINEMRNRGKAIEISTKFEPLKEN